MFETTNQPTVATRTAPQFKKEKNGSSRLLRECSITISTSPVLNRSMQQKTPFPPERFGGFYILKKKAVPVRHSLATTALLLVLCEHELTSEILAEKAIQSEPLRWL